MNELKTAGPAQLVQMAAVARRFFLDGKSKIEIAEEMGLSRFKVARLLDEARSTGLVHIEIRQPGLVNVGLSDRLQEAYGLKHAVVLDVPDEGDPSALRESLGTACANLLSEIVTEEDFLGLAWARSVRAMSHALTSLPPCSVVQLSGALVGSVGEQDVSDSSIELVRTVAAVARGRAAFFYAPMLLPDAATARTLRQQPDVAGVLNLIPKVTIAVVGVGAWKSGLSTVHDTLGHTERERLLEDGVVVEIAGVLLDETGQPITTDLTKRMITISAEQLRGIPEVIGIAYDVEKVRAVRIVIDAGYVQGLVTNQAMAQELLASK